jgi:predicted ArsR family transcriptional regulator
MSDLDGGVSADVLAQPTRRRLFALLEELRRPVPTRELAAILGLHPNGVRAHLERMEQAGLVERALRRGGRGRPPDAWSISPAASPGGQPPQRYRQLVRWLARALASPRRGTRAIQETGRQIGRELAPDHTGDLPQGLESALAALGFQPEVTAHASGAVTVCLRNCPYREAVHENQPAVCALHEGITIGLLERLAPGARLREFVPHDPDQAGCEIRVAPAQASPAR